MDFISHQAEKILACYTDSSLSSCINKAQERDLEKGGEGSKGGKIIGHTRSGKPIYDKGGHENYKEFNKEDHKDASDIHMSIVSEMPGWKRKDSKGQESKLLKHHKKQASYHSDHSKEGEESRESSAYGSIKNLTPTKYTI